MKVGAGFLLLGVVVIAAELWMAVTFPECIVLALLLLGMSGFSWYTTFVVWREDFDHWRRFQRHRRSLREET